MKAKASVILSFLFMVIFIPSLYAVSVTSNSWSYFASIAGAYTPGTGQQLVDIQINANPALNILTATSTLVLNNNRADLRIRGYNGGGVGQGATINGSDSRATLGIIVVGNNSNVTLNTLQFLNGHTTGSGGGVSVVGSASTLRISLGIFTGNTAVNYGGGLYLASAVTQPDVDIIDVYSTFDSNIAGSGGGFAILGGSITVHSESSTYTNNSSVSSSGGGGAIYAAAGTTVTFSSLTNNISGGKGIVNTYVAFTSNTAANDGGAIYNSGLMSMILNTTAEFIGNSAAYGGAIYNAAGGVFNIGDADF